MGMTKKTKRYKTHSSPETAGIQNMPKDYHKNARRRDVNGTVSKTIKIYEHGFKNREDYKGQWDEESLAHEVNEFFRYCAKYDVKPAKAGLRLWLDLSRSQYHAWESQDHGFKTDILEKAAALMELSYIGNIESYPTGNIFLLKSGHGHSDKKEISFTENEAVDESSVRDKIKLMGLGLDLDDD